MVDALSRQEEMLEQPQFQAFTTVQSTLILNLLRANTNCAKMQELHLKLSQGLLEPNYTVKEGLLLYKGKILVLDHEGLRKLLLQEFHTTL